jgi:hypothetical protein
VVVAAHTVKVEVKIVAGSPQTEIKEVCSGCRAVYEQEGRFVRIVPKAA